MYSSLQSIEMFLTIVNCQSLGLGRNRRLRYSLLCWSWLRYTYIKIHTLLYFIFALENILEAKFQGSILLLFGTLVLVDQTRLFHKSLLLKSPLKRRSDWKWIFEVNL